MSQERTLCARSRSAIIPSRSFSSPSAAGSTTGLYPRRHGFSSPVSGGSRGHRRGTLYTRSVANESPELFDDIYLGLQAGGAVRKQRRGEPLSAEEEEVIGRWERLSLWRKFIAIGAFALGTFGLGFTVGGLIFGRWRAARR